MEQRLVNWARHAFLAVKLSLNHGKWRTPALCLSLMGLGCWLLTTPANAQDNIRDQISTQQGNELLAGLAQPYTSWGHFVFIVMLGLVSCRQERGGRILLLFVASSILGAFLRSQGWIIPQEVILMAAVVTLAVMYIFIRYSSLVLLTILGAIAGLLYGYASISVFGSEATPVIGYGLGYGVGFGAMQILIALIALIIGRLISDRQPGQFTAGMQWIGVGMMGAVIVTSILKATGIFSPG